MKQNSHHRMRLLLASGCLPERAGQPAQVQLHTTLDELGAMPGAQDAARAWLNERLRDEQPGGAFTRLEPAAARRAARAGEPGWLSGQAAQAYACDAKVAPGKNADLWRRLDAAAQRHHVQWFWVKGHAGHPENERADALAVQGSHEARALDPALK